MAGAANMASLLGRARREERKEKKETPLATRNETRNASTARTKKTSRASPKALACRNLVPAKRAVRVYSALGLNCGQNDREGLLLCGSWWGPQLSATENL